MMASWPSRDPRGGDIAIVFAQMHAGRAHGPGQRRIVIDHQGHAVVAGTARPALRPESRRRSASADLVPVLQQRGATASTAATRASRRRVSASSGVIR